MSLKAKAPIIVAFIVGLVVGVGIGYGVSLAMAPKPGVPTVKIGVVLPFTGPLAETAKDLKRGIEFAVDEINAAGGIKSLGGAKIEILWGDSEADPSVGYAEAIRLIGEGVVAVVGAYQSSVTKTVSEACERYKVPCINPDSTSPLLTMRGFEWFFRVTAHDDPFAKQHFEFLNWLKETKGVEISTFATICEDTEWGMGCRDVWQKYGAEFGYTLVEDITYHRGAPSLDSEVGRLKAANPDVVFIAAYVTDAILFQKTIYKLGFKPKAIIAMDAGYIVPSYVEEVKEKGYWVFSREVFNWDLFEVVPALKAKNDAYKAKYGVDFNGNSARDYVAIHVLALALEEAGKKVKPWEDLEGFRRALRDALAAIDIGPDDWAKLDWAIMPWDGVKFGATTEGEKGQNVRAKGIIVQMFDDGKYYTVWPREIATKEPVFPMP